MRLALGARPSTALLLAASAAAFSLFGDRAEAVTCSFGNFSACANSPVGNFTISNFSYTNGSGGNIDSDDSIDIDIIQGVYNFDAFFNGTPNPTLLGTGTFSFTVTAAPGYALSSALTNLADSNASGFSTSLSGFSANPLVNQSVNFQNFNPGTTSTDVVVTWNATSGTLTQYELNLTATEVPGPLPLLGAAAAFNFSRKLRKRVQGRA